MPDVELVKRWRVTESHLRHAQSALPSPTKEIESLFRKLESEFFHFLDHNELELALDIADEQGKLVSPRGGFWKDLIRAAETMELADRIPALQRNYQAALSRSVNESE